MNNIATVDIETPCMMKENLSEKCADIESEEK